MPIAPSAHPGRRRVLHLVDPAGDGPCMLRLAALTTQRVAACSHDVVVLGTSGDEASARRCGLRPLGHVPMPGGLPGLAQAATARVAAALRRGAGESLLLHAWGERTARAAHCADAAATMATLARPSRHAPPHAVAVLRGGCVDPAPVVSATIALGEPVHRALASHAGSAEGLHALSPAVDPTALPADPAAARRALRTRWGAAPHELVVGLVGDTVATCNAQMAMYMLALSRVAGRSIRLVMHPAACGTARLLRWSGGLRWGDGLVLRSGVVLDEAILEPWQTAPGLDAALFFTVPSSGGARPASGLCLGWTALCGVPAIAEESAMASDAIDDGRTGFLVAADDHTSGVNRLVRLVDDATLRRSMGDAARNEAQARWSPEVFAQRVGELYGAAGRSE